MLHHSSLFRLFDSDAMWVYRNIRTGSPPKAINPCP